jgi:hypothetical protein
MEHVVRIEVTAEGDAARLYEIFSESADSVTPAQLNRAILETGLVHHALMLSAIGMIPEERQEEVRELIDRIGEKTIMQDLFAKARDYWRNWSDAGGIEPDDIENDEPI